MSLLIFGSGLLIIQKMAKTAQWVAVFGVIGVFFNLFDGYWYMLGLVVFSIFIGIVTFELFHDLIKKKSIELPEIFGALSGYILIGYIGALLFIVINIYYDNAFANVSSGKEGMQDLVYFAYITLLSIGYGEIVPLIPASRNVAIVLGLLSQFYMVVVIATFVGKFLQNPSK
ncbi:MAG: potassium channel family protein [Reichenbachiella sp.]